MIRSFPDCLSAPVRFFTPASRLMVLALLISLALPLTSLAQTTRYVKPGGSGSATGISWANASANLQAMINVSAAGDQIWVAQRAPTSPPAGRTATLALL